MIEATIVNKQIKVQINNDKRYLTI